MTMDMLRKGFAILAVGVMTGVLGACDQEGPAEELGESIDQSADEAGDALEEGVDDAEDAAN